MLTPYLSPEGPSIEKYIKIRGRRQRKTKRTIFRNILPASVDIGLNHDTGDSTVTSNQLLADGVDDFWLVVVVLERISV